MNDDQGFRQHLLALEEKAQAAFDKTVITLSSGALGVSFAFVKDFLGTSPVMCRPSMMVAWAAWVLSLATSLTSHYLSTFAIRQAIHDFDAGKRTHLARAWDRAVVVFNGISGLLFVVGVSTMGVFVVHNLR